MKQFINTKAKHLIGRDVILMTHTDPKGFQSRKLVKIASVELLEYSVKLEISADYFTAPVFLDSNDNVILVLDSDRFS